MINRRCGSGQKQMAVVARLYLATFNILRERWEYGIQQKYTAAVGEDVSTDSMLIPV